MEELPVKAGINAVTNCINKLKNVISSKKRGEMAFFIRNFMRKLNKSLNFRQGSRCPKIAFWQSKFPKNGSLSINYCDIFEKIV